MDMIDNGIVKNMAGMARQGVGTEAYDTIAEVVRTEGSTAWVHIPGGVDETPIAMSVSAKEGDTVRVRVAGGQAWIVGNDTAPPTDDSLAKKALEVAGKYPKIIKTGRIESEDGQSFWDLDEGILNMKGYVTSVKAEYALSMSPTTPPAGSATWTEEYITSIPAAAYLWRRLTVSITAEEALTMVEMIASGSGDLGPITAARQDMQCTYTDSSGAEHEYTLKCLLLYPETMDSATAPEKINLTYGKVETTDGSTIAVPASCLMFTSYINHNITSLSVNFYIVYRAGTEQFYLVYYDGTDGIWKGAAITRGIAEDGTVEFPGGVEVQAPVGWKKRLYSSGPHFDLDAQFHCFMENNSGGGMIHYSNLIEQFVWQTNDAVLASVQFGTPTTVDTVSANQVHIVPVQSANYFNPARRISDLDEFNASYTQKKNIGAVNLLTGTRTAKTVTQGYLPYDEPAEPGLQGCTDIYPVQLTAGRSLPSVKNINTVTLSYEWSLTTRGTAPKSFLVCLPYDSEGLGYYDDYILLDEVTIGSSTGGSRAVTVSVEGMEVAVEGNIAVLYDYGDLEEGQSFTPSKVTVRHMQLEVGNTPTDWAPNPDDYLSETLNLKSTNVENNVTPSANGWANHPLIFRDKNGAEIGRVGVYFTTAGIQYTSIRTTRTINGSTILNEIGLRIGDNGARSVYLSDASIWRNALGVNNEVIVKTASSVSVASGTAWSDGTTITNSGSLAAGTYVIRGYVSFASNATGRRFTAIMTSNTGTTVYNNMVDSRTAINGAATHCNIFGIVTLTAATTLYLRVTQNSGTALTCAGRMEILKIH